MTAVPRRSIKQRIPLKTQRHSALMYDQITEHLQSSIIYTIIISLSLSVLANYRTQFLLDRLGRYLKLFVSNDSTSCHEFASQYGIAFFCIHEKHPKPRGNRVASACVYLNDPSTGHECQRNRRTGVWTLSSLDATDPSNLNGDGGVFVCMRARAHVCPCVCARVCMRADNDNN